MKTALTAIVAAPFTICLLLYPAYAEQSAQAMGSVVSLLPEWPADVNRTEEPEASGVVIFDGRYILTALHVVDRAISVRIRTLGGRVMPARSIGVDPATDLALMKIEARLPPFSFGGDGEPGQAVCAIGNAFGLGLSLACGVVSGVNRAGVGFNAIEDFVQTDAAVNPGASGGALIDRDGKLIGILSAIFTKQSDANIGVNFAVSAPLARRVADALRDHGRVRWLVSGLRLSAGLEKGASGRLGARVARIRDGSAAAVAGFQRGDLIVAAGQRIIRKPMDFTSAMARLTVPAELNVRIVRNGKEHEMVLRFE